MTNHVVRTAMIGCFACLVAPNALATADPPGSLGIDGAVSKPVTFSAKDLASLPHVSVKRIDHGKPVDCTGVPVSELLKQVGLPSGEALRGSALQTVLIASARDGYKVAFSLGELDGSLGNAGAVVADRCGNQPLPADVGPLRLILPKDQRPARSVRELERFTVVAKP